MLSSSQKLSRTRAITRTSCTEQAAAQFEIDDEFRDIIEKQCPGKLYKVLRRRMKSRIRTEPFLNDKPEDPREMDIF